MSLRDTFSKLKTSIVGTKTSGIDAKLDSAVRDIISYKSNSGRNGYIDLVKNLISKGGSMDIGQNIFQQGTTPATFGQGNRLSRYNAYSAILSHINYCQRALDVLTDNILAPDDITKTSLEVNPKSFIEDSENAQANVKDVEEIIQKLKLEDRLDMIVKNTLQFGDFFVEIADEKTALTSKSAFLAETIYHIQNNVNDSSKETLTERIDEKTNVKIIMDFSSLDDIINNDKITGNKQFVSDIDKDKKNKKPTIKPEDLQLLFYDPKRVVKLQSDMFPICFGYLIFPASIMSPQTMLQNQAVNSICQSILKSVEKKIPGLDDQSINIKDLQDVVGSMIKETDFTKAMNIRYVPPDRIQHFQRPSVKYYPYGESIFDSAQFGAKVLIALETAMTILRLNRSIEKRKITVEVGLPRDAAKAIEKLKEEFKRRKISLDSFGSVDTIACLDLNTKICLTNGKKISLSELIRLFNEGHQFEIYAYNHQTGKIAPDKVVSAKVTGRNVSVMKITLDNDESVICTEDHHWMLRDGSYVQAKDLKVDDSLMPFNIDDCLVNSIEYLEQKIDVGDIQTEKFHNFGLQVGVFIHNSQITSFEDIFIPQKDGKSFVDIANMTDLVTDTRSKTDELKFIRDGVIAGVGVPPAFIGMEEQMSAKSNLSEENVMFARTIVNHQKYLTHQVQDLITKIYNIVDPEKALTILNDVEVAFPAPKSLQFERQASYLSNLANLVETLERVGVPKDWSKKKYLSSIDWKEVEQYEIDTKIDKSLGTKNADGLDGVGGMGGGGLMTGGMGGVGGF